MYLKSKGRRLVTMFIILFNSDSLLTMTTDKVQNSCSVQVPCHDQGHPTLLDGKTVRPNVPVNATPGNHGRDTDTNVERKVKTSLSVLCPCLQRDDIKGCQVRERPSMFVQDSALVDVQLRKVSRVHNEFL
jgi:hypothetical protein